MGEQIAPELVERMVALVRELHADHVEHDMHDRVQDFVARTAAIVAELPKPVDPDLIEAKALIAGKYFTTGGFGFQPAHLTAQIEQAVSLGIKRGRELATLAQGHAA